jgi:glyoxylase-like metal-dependent hydrolase (beta-lactamase superfamily II)
VTVKSFVVICTLLLAAAVLRAQAPMPPPAPLMPDTAQILLFPVSDDTFGITNCYLVVGPTGQAFLFDCADRLELQEQEKVIVDPATGKSIPGSQLEKMERVSSGIVRDPADGKEKLVYEMYRSTGKYGPLLWDALKKKKITLKMIVLSHGHMDHIGAVAYIKEKTGAKVVMHEADARQGFPKDAPRFTTPVPKVDRVLKDGETLTLDGMSFTVIHTPGHSPGSMCLYTRYKGTPVLFSGDTLLHYYMGFDGTTYDTGRWNFRDGSGDREVLYKSLRDKLFVLPDDTIVYPAHDEPTTIGLERKHSPALPHPEAEQPADAANPQP